MPPIIICEITVQKPLESVWDVWVQPNHITKWYNATSDWHIPSAEIDLKVGGFFNYRMEAKDGSFGFDYKGVFKKVKPLQLISYKLEDQRLVEITFTETEHGTLITQQFEAERTTPLSQQKKGWQAIMNSFKNYILAQE